MRSFYHSSVRRQHVKLDEILCSREEEKGPLSLRLKQALLTLDFPSSPLSAVCRFTHLAHRYLSFERPENYVICSYELLVALILALGHLVTPLPT